MFVNQPEPKLVHLQSNTIIDLPSKFYSLKVGKSVDGVLVDIDVSGFPSADIVSRRHFEIRQVRGNYYIEDAGIEKDESLYGYIIKSIEELID